MSLGGNNEALRKKHSIRFSLGVFIKYAKTWQQLADVQKNWRNATFATTHFGVNIGVRQPLGLVRKAVKGVVVLLCHCEARLILSQRGNPLESNIANKGF